MRPRHVLHHLLFMDFAAALLPESVPGAEARSAEQPARERVHAEQGGRAAGEQEEDHLGGVFGQRGVVHLAQAGRVDQATAAADEGAESGLRPVADVLAHEKDVTVGIHSGCGQSRTGVQAHG